MEPRTLLVRPRCLGLGLMVAAAFLTAAYLPAVAAESGLVRLNVTLGKSQVISLQGEPFTRVLVTNPNIADVFVATPNQLLVNGKAVGVTSLVVFYLTQTRFFDLVVETDIELLRERLGQVAPREEIHVQPAKDTVILTGAVSSADMIEAAAQVAAVFTGKGKVVNLLTLKETKRPQVLIQVHVAEVAREALRELGFSFRFLSPGHGVQGGTFPGPFLPPRIPAPDFLFPGSSFFLSSPQRDFNPSLLVRALAERNLLRTLAKPNLVTQSGKEAKFLSGGEFPFPVAQRDNTITVQFKEFGVGLIFTPVVDGETINLKIQPEVSTLDFTQGLVSAGISIPVVRKNQTFTNITVRDGESFAIAGLINNEVRQTVTKIPLLGDIPILGALFRSIRFQNNETELLFLVTVKLVMPPPPGSPLVPDPLKLMELRQKEKEEFTALPGIPGVGEVVERPFGKSNLEQK